MTVFVILDLDGVYCGVYETILKAELRLDELSNHWPKSNFKIIEETL